MAWSFSNEGSARSMLDLIKNGEITNEAKIYQILNQIIIDLRGTKVAKEAQKMIDDLF